MHTGTRRCILMAALSCGCLALACDRGGAPTTQAANDPDRVAPPEVKPEYRFEEGLRDDYPEIVAFMQHFLETCLAGDYAGYRKLVSRLCDPESRDRFQAVFHAIRALYIQSIEPIERPRLSDEVYLVVSQVDFHPESKVRLRRKHNAIAILVLKEDDAWRMIPAPSDLQPSDDEPEPTTSAPATSQPDYPWDEDGDF